MDRFDEIVEELNKHLECTNQSWLFGAGVSFDANIPLMKCLTERIESVLPAGKLKTLYDAISSDLPPEYHVEHVLSHLGDHIAIAERSKNKKTTINGSVYDTDKLHELHYEIIKHIGETVRYGYKKGNPSTSAGEEVGKIDKPIIKIDTHLKFVETLFRTKANLLSRSTITMFTTNYDTLLEDAFSLNKVAVNDGFCGSAIGYWNPKKSFNNTDGINIVKLHGSVDWVNDTQRGLIRNRYGVNYLSNDSDVLIYPQATKYIETQKDPFAGLFAEFRKRLNNPKENILVVCGYSFGDDHINSEIEHAINLPENKTILVVFIDEIKLPLEKLLQSENTSNKVFVCTGNGVFHSDTTLKEKTGCKTLNWWQFAKMTDFLKDGEAL